MYAGAAWHYRGRDNIDVAGLGIDILLVLDAPQLAYLVAQLRCPLEVEVLGGLFHCLGQLVGQGATAPLEKHNGMADIFAVFLFAYKADTGRLAALDLVLQARPGAVAKIAFLALPDLEGFLQQTETFADGAGAGIGAEIAPLGLLRTAVQTQPRVGIQA